MKSLLLLGALSLGLLTQSAANAADRGCTTGAKRDAFDNCHDCELVEWNEGINCIVADTSTCGDPNCGSGPAWVGKWIDDCVGNENGQMVPGLGAGVSCKNYTLDNDTLSAQCRAVDGAYKDTSIRLPDYFAAATNARGNFDGLVCAQ